MKTALSIGTMAMMLMLGTTAGAQDQLTVTKHQNLAASSNFAFLQGVPAEALTAKGMDSVRGKVVFPSQAQLPSLNQVNDYISVVGTPTLGIMIDALQAGQSRTVSTLPALP